MGITTISKPSWRIEGDRLLNFTPETLAAYESDIARLRGELEALRSASRSRRAEVLVKAVDACVAAGLHARATSGKRTLREVLEHFAPPIEDDVLAQHSLLCAEAFVRSTKDVLARQAAAKATSERAAAEAALLGEAIIWLQARGRVLNADFTVGNAITTANNAAFDEWAQAQADSGEPVEFDGCNCDDSDCRWYPGARRCQCGNRRVAWEFDGDFRNPAGRAVAW